MGQSPTAKGYCRYVKAYEGTTTGGIDPKYSLQSSRVVVEYCLKSSRSNTCAMIPGAAMIGLSHEPLPVV